MSELLKTHKSFGGWTQFWQHPSRETKTVMRYSTFRPEGPIRGCLIWLSGLTCTEENFMVKAGAQPHLARHHWMVACPDTSPRGLHLPGEHARYDFGAGAGFYVDAITPGYRDHYRMASYVTEEFYDLIVAQFRPPRLAISGHSMGGHGALVLGLRRPDKFDSVSALAPIAHPSVAPWGIQALTGYLGEDRRLWASWDATELVAQGRLHPRPLKIDAGAADEHLSTQLRLEDLAAACQAHRQIYSLDLHPGYDHSYYFVASRIESHVAFHAEAAVEPSLSV